MLKTYMLLMLVWFEPEGWLTAIFQGIVNGSSTAWIVKIYRPFAKNCEIVDRLWNLTCEGNNQFILIIILLFDLRYIGEKIACL